MQFKDLKLPERVWKHVSEIYSEPTEVQALAIPPMIEGRDVFVLSKTGSGKTAAFLLPMSVLKGKALVLTPTRELAKQVWSEAKKLLPNKRSLVVYGGTSLNVDEERLSKRWDILIATPGRCLDHIRRGNINKVELVILDEGDKMLEMGFEEDVKAIMSAVEPNQIGLFSATLNPELKSLLRADAEEIHLEEDNFDIEHEFVDVERNRKLSKLREYLDPNKKTIIFMATKRGVDWLSQMLSKWKVKHAVIHGDLSQRKREFMVGKFRRDEVSVIIATDVLARGIDIPDVDLVISYDEAGDEKTAKHRMGRTGRIGKKGKAVTFRESLPVFDASAQNNNRESRKMSYSHGRFHSSNGQRFSSRQGSNEGRGYGRRNERRHGQNLNDNSRERGPKGRGVQRQKNYGKSSREGYGAGKRHRFK